MKTEKLHPGSPFPTISALLPGGKPVDLKTPLANCDWKIVVVYRGKHCPMCTRYLNQLETHKQALADIGVDMIAVSADNEQQLKAHSKELQVSFPLAYGLTQEQMQQLGLFISQPRSELETDHNFPEPGLFVINDQGAIQVIDISNNPFVRPDLETLVNGLKWIRNPDNNYPIRGTFR